MPNGIWMRWAPGSEAGPSRQAEEVSLSASGENSFSSYSLFAGSDGGAHHWAMVASLINSAKLNAVEPFVYLKDVLERVVAGHTKTSQLDELLPWHWKPGAAVNP